MEPFCKSEMECERFGKLILFRSGLRQPDDDDEFVSESNDEYV